MSSPLVATAKSTTANSYLTVAEANQIARARLYTTVWDTATTTPDADGYSVNGSVLLGVTTVGIDGGVGSFIVGDVIAFGDADSEEYTLTGVSGSTLTFTPALVIGVLDATPVFRLTASQREKALMWSTQLLDAMMVWKGIKRTVEQSLWFPATGVTDLNGQHFDYDELPAILKVGTYELAQHLLTVNAFRKPAALGKGVSSVQLGPLKAKIDSTQEVSVIPENILSLLSELGRLEPEASQGSYVLPLKRI